MPAEPIARHVVLWVGVFAPVLAGIRERLPRHLRAMLDCCDQGFPHKVHVNGGPPVTFKRVRYAGHMLGYGVVVSEWMTIAPRVSIPDYMAQNVVYARRIMAAFGLVARTHLTDGTA